MMTTAYYIIWDNKPVKNPSASNFQMCDGAKLHSSPQQLVCSMQTIMSSTQELFLVPQLQPSAPSNSCNCFTKSKTNQEGKLKQEFRQLGLIIH